MKSAVDMAIELKGQNVKNIFNALDGGYESRGKFEYNFVAQTIMDMVAAGSEGFVKDICERFNSESNRFPMSDKQRWCVAFAFQKVSDEICAKVKAEYEASAAEYEAENI